MRRAHMRGDACPIRCVRDAMDRAYWHASNRCRVQPLQHELNGKSRDGSSNQLPNQSTGHMLRWMTVNRDHDVLLRVTSIACRAQGTRFKPRTTHVERLAAGAAHRRPQQDIAPLNDGDRYVGSLRSWWAVF